MHTFLAVITLFMPWAIKRRVMSSLMGYNLAPSSWIGFSIVLVKNATLEEGAKIGHFTIIRNLERLVIGKYASIGKFNWISGLLRSNGPQRYVEEAERRSDLIIGEHSAITYRHIIDCTNTVSIGGFSTIAGHRSQIITHGIDIYTNRQTSAPIKIGAYCIIGTGCILLKGSSIADRILVGAGSVINSDLTESNSLYAGVPAVKKKSLDPKSGYFNRSVGVVG